MGKKYMKLPEFDYARDKSKIFTSYCDYMFSRLQSMFVYTGLPDSIPVQWLEDMLLRNGSCGIIKLGDELYAVAGSAGGEEDEYGQPTLYVVANPALKKKYPSMKGEYDIGKDCVYARSDYRGIGVTPLVCRYMGLMTENYITARLADINMRMTTLISGSDDTTINSGKQYLKDIEEGTIGMISEGAFFDGVKVQAPSNGTNNFITQLIELQQYTKGSFYNEIGINANFNMKREALSDKEIALNDDMLMPLVDDMLKSRRTMCAEIEELFGVHVDVDFGSSWHANSVEKVSAVEEMTGDDELANNMTNETALNSDEDNNKQSENDLRAAVDKVSQLTEGNGDEKNEDTESESQPESIEETESEAANPDAEDNEQKDSEEVKDSARDPENGALKDDESEDESEGESKDESVDDEKEKEKRDKEDDK